MTHRDPLGFTGAAPALPGLIHPLRARTAPPAAARDAATPPHAVQTPNRLTTVVAGVSTRAGQGLSTFMLHAAWEMAATHQVVLVDMDETGGTIAEALHLSRRVVEGRSAENFYTGDTVTAERIRANAVTLRARPRLAVVPGRSAGACGPGLDAILPRMAIALRSLECDYVFLDLGPCLAYPGLTNPEAVVQAIRRVSTRIVCVLSTDPLPFQHAVQVMRRLGNRLLPDVVMWRWGKEWERELVAAWREQMRGLPIRSLVDWSDAGYSRGLLNGRPMLDVKHAVRNDLRL